MDDNEETAEGLTSRAHELSNTLKCFEDTSIEQRRGELTMHISNLHRFVCVLGGRVRTLISVHSGSFNMCNRGSQS